MKHLILYLLFFIGVCHAQTRRIDSLYKLIANDKEDTLKVNHLIIISSDLKHIIPDSSFAMLNRALNLAQSLNVVVGQKGWLKGMANIYYQLGNVFYYNGKFDEAEIEFNKSLAVSKQIYPPNGGPGAAMVLGSFGQIELEKGNFAKAIDYLNKAKNIFDRNGNIENMAILETKLSRAYEIQGDFYNAIESLNRALKIFQIKVQMERIAAVEGSMGNIYQRQGDFSRSLEKFYKSLKIFESINDKRNAATSLMNIGSVYSSLKNYDKALEAIHKAYQIDKEIGNKKGMAGDLGVIAGIYLDLSRFEEALGLYEQVLEIHRSTENKTGTARALYNIGAVYSSMKSNTRAIEYFLKALELANDNADKSIYAAVLAGLGDSYRGIRDYNSAEKYLLKALVIDTAIGYLEHALFTYKSLSDTYFGKGDYQKALKYYKNYTAAQDSLFSAEKNSAITRHEMNYEFEKKSAATKAEQEKKDAVSKTDALRRKLILSLSVVVLLVLFVFSAFVFRSLKVTKKQNQLIEIKNLETEEQKKIIEGKNKDILDSIYYARRIQNSLLPTEKYLLKNIKAK